MHPMNICPTPASLPLGETIVYERFVGNYALALSQAELSLEEAHKAADLNIISEAHMELSIVHLLRGEIVATPDCFQQIVKAGPNDTNRFLRIASYLNLCMIFQIDHARQAAEIFQNSGDLLGFWLAETHRMIYQVNAGHLPEDLSTTEALGKWGKELDCFSYVLGLGILLGRTGRHLLIRKGDIERSLARYRLAERLYRSLGANSNLGKSIVDQGRIYALIGEEKFASVLFENDLQIWDQEIENEPAKSKFIKLLVFSLDSNIFSLYIQLMDPEVIQRCAEMMKYRRRTLLSVINSISNNNLPSLVLALFLGVFHFGWLKVDSQVSSLCKSAKWRKGG